MGVGSSALPVDSRTGARVIGSALLDIVPSLAAAGAAALTILWEGKRRALAALLALYLVVAWVVSTTTPLQIALGRLVIGTAVIYILARAGARSPMPSAKGEPTPVGIGFRAAAILLILIPVSGVWGLGVLATLPTTTASGLGSLWVMGLGALHVGLSRETEPRIIGLLTLLLGFEMIYISLEPSLALTALLAAVHLGLALVSVYLTSLPIREEAA